MEEVTSNCWQIIVHFFRVVDFIQAIPIFFHTFDYQVVATPWLLVVIVDVPKEQIHFDTIEDVLGDVL